MKDLNQLSLEFHDANFDIPPHVEGDSQLVFRCNPTRGPVVGIAIQGFEKWGFSVSGGYPTFGMHDLSTRGTHGDVQWLSGNFDSDLFFVGNDISWEVTAPPEESTLIDAKDLIPDIAAFDAINSYSKIAFDNSIQGSSLIRVSRLSRKVKKSISLIDFLEEHHFTFDGEPLVDFLKPGQTSRFAVSWIIGSLTGILIESVNVRAIIPLRPTTPNNTATDN